MSKREDGLTDAEGEVMDALVTAWNKFIALNRTHESELSEFANGIHLCQYQLMARVLQRDYPMGYPTKKGVNNGND